MKVGTFFSGVGGPEQALKNLDIKHEIEFACDIDKYAKQTYLKNFNPKLFATDITALDMTDLPYVDLLIFGFPCQAFSLAGKRQGFDDTRGTLFYDALRYLKEHRPRYFIAENVKGLLSHDNGKTFQTIIDCLAKTTNYQMSLMPFENLGYHIHYKVLNTKDFGLPQNRERIFIIGIRDDKDNKFRFPKEIPLELKLKDILQDNPNSKYYLKVETVEKLNEYNKRNKDKGNGFQAKFHNPETENMSALKIGGAGADDLICHSLYPRSSKTGKGGTGHLSKEDGTAYCLDTGNAQAIEWIADYRNDEGLRIRKDNNSPCLAASKNSESEPSRMPPIIKKNTGKIQVAGYVKGKSKNPERESNAVLNSNGISMTLTAQGGGNTSGRAIIKNNKIRRLTPIECERLQGFPDNFTEGVSDTQRYKQMGNTITVNVIQAILKNLKIN